MYMYFVWFKISLFCIVFNNIWDLSNQFQLIFNFRCLMFMITICDRGIFKVPWYSQLSNLWIRYILKAVTVLITQHNLCCAMALNGSCYSSGLLFLTVCLSFLARRISVPDSFVDMLIGRLRSDDVYNQVWPQIWLILFLCACVCLHTDSFDEVLFESWF